MVLSEVTITSWRRKYDEGALWPLDFIEYKTRSIQCIRLDI